MISLINYCLWKCVFDVTLKYSDLHVTKSVQGKLIENNAKVYITQSKGTNLTGTKRYIGTISTWKRLRRYQSGYKFGFKSPIG